MVCSVAMVVKMKPPKQANKYIGRIQDQLIIIVQQRMSKAKIRGGVICETIGRAAQRLSLNITFSFTVIFTFKVFGANFQYFFLGREWEEAKESEEGLGEWEMGDGGGEGGGKPFNFQHHK